MKGETISFADELVLDDIFQLRPKSLNKLLSLIVDQDAMRLDDESGLPVHLDSCLTFMDAAGGTHEAIILVAVEAGAAAEIYVLPLGDIRPRVDYRLVGIARHTATLRFADAATGSFAKGTRISLSGGRICPIEDLRQGDEILTRDAGPQPLRKIIRSTLRATGSFAPVVIAKGALNNDGPLVIRADHRLFIDQRGDHIGVGRSEVLIKAHDLVDGKKITRRTGGFVDYYQLVFDDHHIIYAEVIAAESHLDDPRTGAVSHGADPSARHDPRRYHDYAVEDNLIDLEKAAALLRMASGG
jgi:hypothetical protein